MKTFTGTGIKFCSFFTAGLSNRGKHLKLVPDQPEVSEFERHYLELRLGSNVIGRRI
jgi:hypothetical protein